jgi:putative transcriptional regulator
MSPRHHPTEEFLLQYASGEATEPFALLVAAHVNSCAACRAAVAQAEALGGVLLDEIVVASSSPKDLEDGVAAALARAERMGDSSSRRPDRRLAPPLGDYVPDFDSVRWRSLGPGIQHSVLAKDRFGAVARLLRIAPGRSVFEHGHRGSEMTLVLAGSYRSADIRFQPGDVECADGICLAVTDAPLRFRNALGRLMQPFIRI